MFSPLLKPGDAAPAFRLLDTRGRSVGLEDFAACRGVLLLFFASDWLGADLKLLQDFAEAYPRLDAAGLAVLGVSAINWETQYYLAHRLNLPYPLLFDPCCRFARKFRAQLIPKFITGRAVFGVDPEGKVIFSSRNITPKQVLAAFKN